MITLISWTGPSARVSLKTRATSSDTSSASTSRRTETRIAAAELLYDDGETTLGTAARLAGLNRFEMREILREEEVELRVGPDDMEAAREEIKAARTFE